MLVVTPIVPPTSSIISERASTSLTLPVLAESFAKLLDAFCRVNVPPVPTSSNPAMLVKAAVWVAAPFVIRVRFLPFVMPLVMVRVLLSAMLPLPCRSFRLSLVVRAEESVRPPVASLRPILMELKPVWKSELPVSQLTGMFMAAEPPMLMAVLAVVGCRLSAPDPFTVAPKLPQLSICSVMSPVVPVPVL